MSQVSAKGEVSRAIPSSETLLDDPLPSPSAPPPPPPFRAALANQGSRGKKISNLC